jgi:hypothetical protein
VQNFRTLIAVAILLFLFGCASVSIPTRLGMTEVEWSSYTSDKQEMLLAKNKYIKNKESVVANDVFLEVGIHDGKVMMPPFNSWQDYNPTKFIISKDQCRSIVLQQPTDETAHTELEVCFNGNALYMDPSHYDLTKKNGTISINFSPLWLSGFSYKGINSSGYVRLNNVTVKITQAEKN